MVKVKVVKIFNDKENGEEQRNYGEIFETTEERASYLYSNGVVVYIEEPTADKENVEDIEEPTADKENVEDIEEPTADEENAEDIEEPTADEENAEDIEETTKTDENDIKKGE